jgi:hypothetical protein
LKLLATQNITVFPAISCWLREVIQVHNSTLITITIKMGFLRRGRRGHRVLRYSWDLATNSLLSIFERRASSTVQLRAVKAWIINFYNIISY